MSISTVAILEVGRPPDELQGVFGSYPQMVERWLDFPGARYTSYSVLDSVFPRAPDEADLWVITGSKFGVCEEHPWIPPLEEFIRACRDAQAPMFGICFGHQVIAKALGGRVAKSEKGWGLGVHTYDKTPDLAFAEGLALQAYHQDQVVVAPEGSVTVASSPFCAQAALLYPGFALTVQGHPEFSQPYAEALLHSRRGTTLPVAAADEGIIQSRQPVTTEALAKTVIDMFGK